MSAQNPLIVGEVLFDVFPDHQQVLGGAPFNVAWHLHGLGMEPTLLSRIGDDQNGKTILEAMQNWGLSTELIQQDDSAPSGSVNINLHNNGSHSFNIGDNQAWDNLKWTEQLNQHNNKNTSWIYHGSLAMRHAENQALLQQIQQADIPVFLDINLRDPWWDRDSIIRMIHAANWLKINDEEFQQIVKSDTDAPDWCQRIPEMHQNYHLDGLIVTCGASGAWIYDGDELLFSAPETSVKVKDTVGAGDAFTAICIFGLSHHWSTQIILNRALAFAAAICEIQGATTSNRTFYENFLQSWQAKNQT